MLTLSQILLYGVPVLILVVLIVFTVVRGMNRRKRRAEAEFSLKAGDLKGLEQKQLLTKEELKAVRQAMARQYLEFEKAEEEGKSIESSSALEALAREAARAEEELAKKRTGGSAPATATKVGPLARPDTPDRPPPEKNSGPPEDIPAEKPMQPPANIPEHLRPHLERPEQELQDLFNAGFLSEGDLEILMKEKRRCPECGE